MKLATHQQLWAGVLAADTSHHPRPCWLVDYIGHKPEFFAGAAVCDLGILNA